jgi:hypothetical protein
MKTLIAFLKSLFTDLFESQATAEERYLAAATDVYDLEDRMRTLDRARASTNSLGFSLAR